MTGENVLTVFESMAKYILCKIDSGEIDPTLEVLSNKYVGLWNQDWITWSSKIARREGNQ